MPKSDENVTEPDQEDLLVSRALETPVSLGRIRTIAEIITEHKQGLKDSSLTIMELLNGVDDIHDEASVEDTMLKGVKDCPSKTIEQVEVVNDDRELTLVEDAKLARKLSMEWNNRVAVTLFIGFFFLRHM